MGTVLEMTARLAPLASALALAGLLAACAAPGSTPEGEAGTDPTARLLGAVGTAQRVFRGLGSETSIALPRAVPGGFTPEAIAAEPSEYRLVQVTALGLNEVARVVQRNGSDLTLALQSGQTASFRGGVLAATHGFPEDLVALDAPGLTAILRAGGGSLTRHRETLDAQDQTRVDAFACTVVAAGAETVDLGLRQVQARRLDERCTGERVIFDNVYWLDGTGDIVASRQFVSPSVAYLRANPL